MSHVNVLHFVKFFDKITTYFILKTILQGGNGLYYFSHFIPEETQQCKSKCLRSPTCYVADMNSSFITFEVYQYHLGNLGKTWIPRPNLKSIGSVSLAVRPRIYIY